MSKKIQVEVAQLIRRANTDKIDIVNDMKLINALIGMAMTQNMCDLLNAQSKALQERLNRIDVELQILKMDSE